MGKSGGDRCTIESILSGYVTARHGNCTGSTLPALQDIYSTRCQKKVMKILKDLSHLSHGLFTTLSPRSYTRTAGLLGKLTTLCSLHNLRRQSGVFSHQKYRQYCTESENERKRTGGHGHHGITVIGIPDPLTWIRNKVHIYMIELYFQLGISSVEFDNGIKQGLVHVSTMMSNGNFEELRGVIVVYAQQRCKSLSETQRRHLATSLDDIIFILNSLFSCFLLFSGRKFCFIVMRFWHMSTADVPEDQESTKIFKMATTEEDGPQKKIVTAVYEFHWELTKGAEPDWTVTNIWH
ncbi:m-AAA protease-interacting protein 1, mitochondrial-like [Oncorhynchus clarkii lewisi]|uniref:m-AAA protease-interacting protein 1, mitochondrial-like n=1 Tax=Oncorhynchus clarkii lewisi TaxID=490388 RepID=UPI0039B9B03D